MPGTSTAVVILNYNGANLLNRFLPSVIRHSPSAHIIVADNASTDESLELLRKSFPEVQVIALDKNYGYSGGYNRALAQTDAEYCVLLNSDVEVTAGWLEPLVNIMKQHPDIAAIQPKILAYQKPGYFEYAGAGGGFLDTLGYPFCRGRVFDFTEKDTGQYNDTREVGWASGACLMVRTSVYRSLGGLDEDFFAHMEEIDLCWRMIRSGRKVFYCGMATVYHVGAGTLAYGHPQKIYLNFRNNLRLLCYHLPLSELGWKLPLRLLLDWAAAMRFVFLGNTKGAASVCKAHFNFFSSLWQLWQKRTKLRRQYPFSTRLLYKGLIVWDYFVRKRLPVIP
ncbi:MAG: glycosyl transferase family 2 [Cyclobacteriaceae bacterium]|nr:MAG: glycosyl transferase family 2 [Cyclobacteriaceae bacterium]